LSSYLEACARALSDQGRVGKNISGFKERSGQQLLARAIAENIETQTSLVAEAGTGVGKTFAYLVPALLQEHKVLISTGTKNLQDQLFHKDLPAVLKALGTGQSIANLKGRSNYVCRYHLRHNLAQGEFESKTEITQLKRIERFAEISQDGERSQALGISEDAPAWSKAVSTRENCLSQDCPDYGNCFVFRARQRAQQADVVVVNHHLFCADLALRDEGIAEFLPQTQVLVFDEAHQLPEVASQFFGASLSLRQLLEFCREVRRLGMAEARGLADWLELLGPLELGLREIRLEAGAPGKPDGDRLRLNQGLAVAIQAWLASLAVCNAQLVTMTELSKDLGKLALRGQEIKVWLERWLGDLKDANQAERILWADVRQNGLTLHATPLSVAEPFRKHRGAKPRSWIFLSATLSMAGKFDHFQKALGLEDVACLQAPSPFDFEKQGRLLVLNELGDPNQAQFARHLVDEIWPLVQENAGRCFILCTSLRQVDDIAERFRAKTERENTQAEPSAWGDDKPAFDLLVQGSMPRHELLDRFKKARAPILVGSASFWEGVDVPGQQLSMVVIAKLPFAPPDDPIVKARSLAIKKEGGDAFGSYQLPLAALSLKQGVGRLVRTEEDYGLIVIGDSRVSSKSYGRTLLRSLPPFARLTGTAEAIAYLKDAQGSTRSPA
jgi:ATP-dependent DNA helicase DinG